MATSFGQWLKRRRIAVGLSQEELGRHIACAGETVRKFEANTRRPSRPVLNLLAEVFNIPVDEREVFIAFARLPPGVQDGEATRGTEDDPAPWRIWWVQRNNLPIPPTELIGREREVAALEEHLRHRKARVLTLTGPPGVGKTRLALAVAAQPSVNACFEDGICFVALEALSDPELVPAAIAKTLGLKESSATPLAELIREHLAAKRLLLVLDNFEHLLAAAAAVADWLGACPWLTVLATSRVPLYVRGERRVVVPPLALPDPQCLPPVAELGTYGAVRLFVERAQAVQGSFRLTEHVAGAVAEICCRLDGLPLAIELAAARSELLSPAALLTRLAHRLALLTHGPRNLPARQQTLRAAIAWSYDLLTPMEQQRFRQLGVFHGGATLAAIAMLSNAGSTQDAGLLEELESLVSKGLAQVRPADDGEPRFVMLETILEYAREMLVTTGEEAALRDAHLACFLALAEQAAPQLTGPEQRTWLDRLEREHDNLRAALAWARDRRGARPAARAVRGLRLAAALSRFWDRRGHYSEGRAALATTLASTTETGEADEQTARAMALYGAGWLAGRQGDYNTAQALLSESLTRCRTYGDGAGMGLALTGLGMVADARSEYATAWAYFEQSLALATTVQDQWSISRAHNWLGLVAFAQQDYALARTHLVAGLATMPAQGDPFGEAVALGSLGLIATAQGDYRMAQAHFAQALALNRALDQRRGIAVCLAGLAGVRVGRARGDSAILGRTAQLLGAAAAVLQEAGAVLDPQDRVFYEQNQAAVRAILGETRFAAEWAAGQGLTLDAAIVLALDGGD
jgi:non-specific serine/threonine protein kinase